jgi:hypothetical protein
MSSGNLKYKCVLSTVLKKMILTQQFYGWGLPYWAFLAHLTLFLFLGYEQRNLGDWNVDLG